MNLTSILEFTYECFVDFVQSGVFSYVVMPLFWIGAVIICLRVVKYIVQFN